MGYLDPVDTTIGMIERVGLLEKLMLKLLNSSEKALRSLVEALREIKTSTVALRDALISISNVLVTSELAPDVASQLDSLASGTLEHSVKEAKGSCFRIDNIYKTYLSGALSNILNSDESSDLYKLFDDLSKSDASFLEIAAIISGRVKQAAKNLRSLLDDGDTVGAKSLVLELRKESSAKVERLNTDLAKMLELEKQFVKRAGLT